MVTIDELVTGLEMFQAAGYGHLPVVVAADDQGNAAAPFGDSSVNMFRPSASELEASIVDDDFADLTDVLALVLWPAPVAAVGDPDSDSASSPHALSESSFASVHTDTSHEENHQ